VLTLKRYRYAQNYACPPCASIDQGHQRPTRAGDASDLKAQLKKEIKAAARALHEASKPLPPKK
jgi:hypothetical protein